MPTSTNTQFARSLRDTHARRGPLEVCKEDTAFVRSLMETKEFPIEIASRNYISATRQTCTWKPSEIMHYARNLDYLVIW